MLNRSARAARAHEISSYLDGARLWNAAIATGRSIAELARPFDLVSVAFSKGLGAPGGSLLAGTSDTIGRGVRARRMFGGAMRQAGFFGAAALYALDHHVERLAVDHQHARLIADRLVECPAIDLDIATVQTNIVIFNIRDPRTDAGAFVAEARRRGVLLVAFGPATVRAVTHLDVTKDACEQAAEVLAGILARA